MADYREAMRRMSSLHKEDAPLEDPRSAGVDESLAEFPNGFAKAVKGLLNNRAQKRTRHEELSRREINVLCHFHNITIESIEKSLGFSLGL